MQIFKNIDRGGISRESSVTHYVQNLISGSDKGLNSITIVSGSTNTNYWHSLNLYFYTSGSPRLNEISPQTGLDEYDNPSSNFSIYNSTNPQHVNKFHTRPTSQLISIPQIYYGETIKKGSFKLTNLNNTNNDGKNPIIKDDGFGNLYSTNAEHSQSAATSISSSDNYVGNIFYDWGIAVLTETASWSGSVNYTDMTTGNHSVRFQSTNTIYTNEYTVIIQPHEFNYSMNYSLRCFPTGSGLTMPANSASFLSNPYLCNQFTSSDFQPYITQIHLWSNDGRWWEEPVISATLPKPVQVSPNVTTIFKLRLDM